MIFTVQYCEQVINYCVSKNDNKLLVVLIFQDLEEPLATAACSFLFTYHCLNSKISGSSYCAWTHIYLNIKKKPKKL